ncbi:MAG: DNA mismatch repair endonuclease MutL [archaeon]
MVIKRLSKETINLISAGEAIESPADILKELIENSIDANAKQISISIKNSGIDLLEIKDDGVGISKADLEICTERHTTSKITNIDELYSINTFGFRGEALASINAVSKLAIVTSTNANGKGYLLENEKIKEVSSQKGTTITVKDLFYNLPVRKKFLKSKSAEFTLIYDMFLAYVLLYPQIRFSFDSEKKKIVFPSSTKEQRYNQIFGVDIKNKTIPLNISTDLFKLSGLISLPTNQFYFPTNFLFINKRYVYSTQVQKTITSCYRDYLMVQQKPFFILFIELDPKTIDVNVHPKKRIVKLQNEMIFLSLLKDAIENELYKGNEKISSTKTLNEFSFSLPSISSRVTKSESKVNTDYPNSFPSISKKSFISDFKGNQKIIYSENNEFSSSPKKLQLNNQFITKIIGQIHDTYIVCETTTGTLLIDQHAAAERINLEKNRLTHTNSFDKQRLITGIKLDKLSIEQKELISKNILKLSNLGFEVKKDKQDYSLITVPKFLNNYLDINYFQNILDDLKEKDNTVDKLKDNLIKLYTCKNSIKANEPLSYSEQMALINDLEKCKDKTICAHGRPTIIYFSKKELEKMFKRII